MRNDSGQSYTIMRVLPGTFAVHGDPDFFITFHTSWPEAKAALLAAVAKNKRIPPKNWEPNVAAAGASLTVSSTGLKKWSQVEANRHMAEKYVETYALGFICLAYANGLSVQYGDTFVFLGGDEELPTILDQFEAFRYLPKLTPKPEAPNAGTMTREEIDRLFEAYGLGAQASAAQAEENPPL